ncbi:putative transposase [Undibacterium sp. GrIS 1.8]|uniref:RNA-guided endonuclease InsQ/TnpB family protein n=1 Tax=Undibacterium sp. GrIS 1.8 TaxID=3143934 RepID=UPI00339879F7
MKGAYSRFFSKLGGRPTIHKRHGKQSAWLMADLFEFTPIVDAQTGEITAHQLAIGTKKYPVGTLQFKAHKQYKIPASIHISLHCSQWHVSFNDDDGTIEPNEKDTAAWLMQHTEAELREMTVGLDRGVHLPLAGSDGQQFGFTEEQEKRLKKQDKHKKRWQRRLAKRDNGSARWVKAKRKVARYQRYGADMRRDVAHKTSHALATDPRYKLYVFEALKVKNMTKKAKPKQDEQARWIKNGAAAKSGLNKSILASTWGSTKVFLQYKARSRGKLVLEVPPFYSSQECAACGHIHQDNRVSQSEFVCLRCGNTDHADLNAGKVIALRGVRQLLAGQCAKREKKRTGIVKSKVGAGCSEPAGEIQPSLDEIVVSLEDGNIPALWSLTRETPATRLFTV